MTLPATLTVEQAAAYLKVRKTTVQALARSGALPGLIQNYAHHVAGLKAAYAENVRKK